MLSGPGGPTDEDRQEGGRQLSTEPTPEVEQVPPEVTAPEPIPLLAPRDGLPPVVKEMARFYMAEKGVQL